MIMDSFGIAYDVIPADVDERAIIESDPYQRCQLLARQKAEKVARDFPEAWILAADTYVIFGKEMLEKPLSLTEAVEMIEKQSGQWLEEVSGCCYYNPNIFQFVTAIYKTKFRFRDLEKSEIDRYVKENPVLTWSAAFSPAYPAGAALIAEVQGSLTSFSYGLPAEWAAEVLAKLR